MKKERVPWWLREKEKRVVQHILIEINKPEYQAEIEKIIQNTEFCTKISYEVKCVIVIFLHLQTKGFPIVIEDMIKYCTLNKISLLSAISKNRVALPYLKEHTEDYVRNVYRRVYESLLRGEMHPENAEEEVMHLHKMRYFYNRSPLIACVYLCMKNEPINQIINAYQEILPDVNIRGSVIEKEIVRINQAKGKITITKTMKESEKKYKKIEYALQMYKMPIKNIKVYANEYDTLLIEHLVKKNIPSHEIHNLTKKGMEYYADWE